MPRKRVINPTTVPTEEKESYRWLTNVTRSTHERGDPGRCVHIGDRGGDIFELFHAAHTAHPHFLVRTSTDRLAGRGDTKVSKVMRRQPIRGTHSVEIRDDNGKTSQATVHVRFHRITIHPSAGKRKRYGPLSLTVIHAIERSCPTDREPIRWKLLTDLPVEDLAMAVEKLDWYAMRWKIETFHKVLKSGCRAEQSKLRSTLRLTNFRAVRRRVARVLADHDEPGEPGSASGSGIHTGRNQGSGHDHRRSARQGRENRLPLSVAGGQTGRPPCKDRRPAAREYGRLAWTHSPCRHPSRL